MSQWVSNGTKPYLGLFLNHKVQKLFNLTYNKQRELKMCYNVLGGFRIRQDSIVVKNTDIDNKKEDLDSNLHSVYILCSIRIHIWFMLLILCKPQFSHL